MRLSLNIAGNVGTYFLHKPSLTDSKISNLRNAFQNHTSADVKLSKTKLSTIAKFLRNLLGPVFKSGLPLTRKYLHTFWVDTLRLTASKYAADGGNQKKNSWIWNYNIDKFKWRKLKYHEKLLNVLKIHYFNLVLLVK